MEHEKRLHFIAVRRDFTGFQHVHPRLAARRHLDNGSLDLTPGQWRVFADFKPTDADGTHPRFGPVPCPGGCARRTRRRDDAHGHGRRLHRVRHRGPGGRRALDADRCADRTRGRPVTDLHPYLGAYGHLVALRGGDLAYLHVHPDGEPGDGKTQPGPAIEFGAEVPSDGTYHLYLDFKHDGVVRTAQFQLDATATGTR